VIDDLVVHGAAAERVRVRDERGVESVGMAGVEKRFKASGWAAKVFDGLYVGAERRHSDEFTRAQRIFEAETRSRI
jgi:hypothetical protein